MDDWLLGYCRDCVNEDFYKVEGAAPNGFRGSFSVKGGTLEECRKRLPSLKTTYPEYNNWVILRFERWIKVTKVED